MWAGDDAMASECTFSSPHQHVCWLASACNSDVTADEVRAALEAATKLPYELRLMIENDQDWAPETRR
jgi:hypothetical protein